MKRSEDRITIALCSNASGNIKIKPFVIGKARPRCFARDLNPDVYVQYRHNTRALMTSELFSYWLRHFDRTMRLKEGDPTL